MDKFDQYDLVAYLAPGALVLISYGLLWSVPGQQVYGDATLAVAFAIGAYATGHMCDIVNRFVRTVGERLVNPHRFRWPAEAINFLDDDQEARLETLLRTRLCRKSKQGPLVSRGMFLGPYAWQMQADLAANGRTKWLDRWNRLRYFYGTAQVAAVAIAVMLTVKALQSNLHLLVFLLPLGAAVLACAWMIKIVGRSYDYVLIQEFLLLPNVSPEHAIRFKPSPE